MENLGTSLKVRCAAAGTTLKEVCERAGVTYNTVYNWSKEEPKSLKAYRALLKAIEKIEEEKKAAANADAETISE